MGNRSVHALGGYARVLETPGAAFMCYECGHRLLSLCNNAKVVRGRGWRGKRIRGCRSRRGGPDSFEGKGRSICVCIAVSLLVASHRLWYGFVMGRNQTAGITEVLAGKSIQVQEAI